MAVEIKGKVYRNLPEQVEENANNIERLLATISEMGNIMRYKGSVATYDDLPPAEDNQVGDVWNVLDTGNNYAWDGEAWDEISSLVDLTGYVEKIALAPLYDDTNTYALGVLVFYGEELYECTTAVTTPEAFDPSKWTPVYLNDLLFEIKTKFDNYVDLTNAQTITGVKTFSNGINIGNSNVQLAKPSNADRLYAYIGGNAKIKITAAETYFVENVLPDANNTYDLGSPSYAWKDLYLSRDINISSNRGIINASNKYVIRYDGGNGLVDTEFTFCPRNNDSYSLGTSGRKWKRLFLSGYLSDGNNSSYGLSLPDTTSWTANKTIATVDDIPSTAKTLYRHNLAISFTYSSTNYILYVDIIDDDPTDVDTTNVFNRLAFGSSGGNKTAVVMNNLSLSNPLEPTVITSLYTTYFSLLLYINNQIENVQIYSTDITQIEDRKTTI